VLVYLVLQHVLLHGPEVLRMLLQDTVVDGRQCSR
jgi:hypothetical protein